MSVDALDHSLGLDPTPLVVDVDGTLLKTDLLQEAALQFIARRPLQVFQLPIWLMGGKASLKTRLADHIDPGLDTVPLREEVVSAIRVAQAEGRPIYLASASDRRYVEALAHRLGGIAGVFATEPHGANLAGAAKAERLVEAFGAYGYDYIGDNDVDFPVWRSARRVLAVAHDAAFASKIQRAFPDAAIVGQSRLDPLALVRALRLHQWAKNTLVFLPLIAGHRLDIESIAATIVGFFCFCFAASAAYVVNDLLDLPGDRDHPRKSTRPFAAGSASIIHGLILSLALMATSIGLAWALPTRFALVLLIYVACTLCYSLFLKRKLLIDVVVLGGLYTLRIYGGLAATGAQQTQWLLMFSLFFFMSLAIVKRCSELVAKREAGKTSIIGRGYRVDDLAIMLPLGAAAGYGAIFVVALYLNSPEVAALYNHPNRMWLVTPLLIYWISRVLLMSNRGDLHDDPVVFALTDRKSWLVGFLVAAVIAISI